MSRERTENLAETTLNGSITSGQTNLTVQSTSGFPSVPQFRITVGDNAEIMLVTSIAGSVYQVDRAPEGPAAVAHGDGAAVRLTQTREGQRRYHRDWVNPFFDVGAPMQLLDINGVTLTGSDFTNVNFTNATKTDQSQGSILLEHDTQAASNDLAIIDRAAPTAPWTLTVGIIPNLLNGTGAFPSCGPCIREAASGEIIYFQFGTSDNLAKALVSKHDSPTVASTSFLARRDWYSGGAVKWFKIEDNNTDIIYGISADGVNFVTLGQEARTAFLTPDRIGFVINNFGNGAIETMATLVAWEEKTP